MIKKIVKGNSRHYPSKLKYVIVYTVHDEDDSGELGFIGLNEDNEVHFKVTEEVFLEVADMCILCEFMDRLKRIAENKELNTLRDEYYYGVEPRQTESPDKTS